MVSLIKNQILKHLTKFTKNMSPDKINVSTLKGEGELCNLELDEVVLMDLMDLPTWLKLTKAICNRVAIKIQWTKLKSQPICVFLDEIVVEMETCPEPRKPSATSNIQDSYSSSAGGKYGFADRVIDGMYVSINSVIVNFKSFAFHASIQLSRIIVQSKTPTWQVADLRMTRIKDEARGEVLIFKEVDWQTLRIEANALEGVNKNLPTTPLRLIANQSKIRITIKKRLTDCGIVGSKLQLNLDDVLWVLTDSQLKAAIVFVNSLKEVIKKSSQQSKLLAMEKVQKQGQTTSPSQNSPSQSPQRQPQQQKAQRGQQPAVSQLFSKYDVIETSYHFHTGRIDLHLCDESSPEDLNCPRRVDGGAMQITLYKLCLDHYPYHPAGSERSHYYRYDENMMARHTWAQDLMAAFRNEVKEVFRKGNFSPPTTPTHAPTQVQQDPHRSPSKGQQASVTTRTSAPPSSTKPPHMNRPPAKIRQTRLLEGCFIIRMEDFTLYRVSTPDLKRSQPKKFLSSDKRQLLLPPDMSSIHVEYTDYYFPEGIDYPVPHSNLYMVVNPIRLNIDYLTALWMNTFALNLLQKVDLPRDEGPKVHVDFKLDALMPRIIIPSDSEVSRQPDRPEGLQIQISRLTITNSHINGKSSLSELSSALQQYEGGRLFSTASFPNDKEDLVAIPDSFGSYASGKESLYINSLVDGVMSGGISPGDCPFGDVPVTPSYSNTQSLSSSTTTESDKHANTYYGLTAESLKHDSYKDIYCLIVEQFWVEFVGVSSSKSRPVPFVESFPVVLWISQPLLSHSLSRSSTTNSLKSASSEGSSHSSSAARKDGQYRKLLKQYYSTSDEEEEVKLNDDEESSQKEGTLKAQLQSKADIHIIAKVGSKVNVQMNHYQFLFLMRLVERIVKFQADMEEDTVAILESSLPSKKICVALVVREVEFAMIGPPVPEAQSCQSSPMSEEVKDTVFDETADAVTSAESQQRSLIDSREDQVDDPEDETVQTSNQTNGHQVNFSNDLKTGLEPPAPINKSHSDSDINCFTSCSDFINQNGFPPVMDPVNTAAQISSYSDLSVSGEDFPRVLVSSETGSVSMRMGNDSPLGSSPKHASLLSRSSLESREVKKDIKKSINNAFTNFSKGFGNLNSKIKQNLLEVGEDTALMGADDWETMSQKSGMSDDDEDFLVINLQNFSSGAEVPVFDHQRRASDCTSIADGASDEKDADVSSLNTLSSSMGVLGVVRQKRVSVVTFKLYNGHLIVQNCDKSTVISAEVAHIEPCEYGNINLDKFQQLFTAAREAYEDSKEDLSGIPDKADFPVKLRLDLGQHVEARTSKSGDKSYLHAMVNNVDVTMNISSLTNIAEIFEDEVIAAFMPLLVEVTNCSFTLKSDTPPLFPTSPGIIPMTFKISHIVLDRTSDGVYRIKADTLPVGLPSEKLLPIKLATRDVGVGDEVIVEDIGQLGLLANGHNLTAVSEIVDPRPHKERSHEAGTVTDKAFNVTVPDKESSKARSDQDVTIETLQKENMKLLTQLVKQNDEMSTLEQERDSLLATLRLLQEELQESEQMRLNTSGSK